MAKAVVYRLKHSDNDNVKVSLCNGDIIVVKEGEKSLMVVSYTGDNSYSICSIVDLKSGGRICPEAISRSTCMWDLLKHMRLYSKNQSLSTKDIRIINHDSYNFIIEEEE